MSESKKLLLEILLTLKEELKKLHANEPTKYNLLSKGGICAFIEGYACMHIIQPSVMQDVRTLFLQLCHKWPECRIDSLNSRDFANCVVSYSEYLEQLSQKVQWVNLRRLELLEFTIKELQNA
jgi:hypothetical protein